VQEYAAKNHIKSLHQKREVCYQTGEQVSERLCLLVKPSSTKLGFHFLDQFISINTPLCRLKNAGYTRCMCSTCSEPLGMERRVPCPSIVLETKWRNSGKNRKMCGSKSYENWTNLPRTHKCVFLL